MTSPNPLLKFESGDSIEIESRAFDGPRLHIGHDHAAFSKLSLTSSETIALISELIASLTRGMAIGVTEAAEVRRNRAELREQRDARTFDGLALCRHGHALCSICNVIERNSIPAEISQ